MPLHRIVRERLESFLADARRLVLGGSPGRVLPNAAKDALSAQVLAGAVVAAFEAAVDAWVAQDARVPLARLFARAFEQLRSIHTAQAKRRRPS